MLNNYQSENVQTNHAAGEDSKAPPLLTRRSTVWPEAGEKTWVSMYDVEKFLKMG